MKEKYLSMNELPATLNAKHIQDYLGISRAMAYNLLRSEGFPTLHIGTRKVIPKDQFIIWVNENTNRN